MELGKFIKTVIQEITNNVKRPVSIGGEHGDIELDLVIDTSEDKIMVCGWQTREHVSRIKIPLNIYTSSDDDLSD